MTMSLSKRQLMLAGAGLMTSQVTQAFPVCTQAKNQICNVTKLYSVTAGDIVVAKDVDDIRRILKGDAMQISIGGGRYSMGGQTAVSQGVQIDMRSFKQLVWIKPMERIVRVQAGMRWRDLQTILDPLDLSVQTMQSYANFTVEAIAKV
jgi:FAD/FMN-containing dehydrogenase